MHRSALLWSILLSLLCAFTARATELTGSPALSLAARIGDRSPSTSLLAKGLLGVYLDGRPKARYLGRGAVEVTANAVDCMIGNVDITAKQCVLTFGAKKIVIKGKDAQALYATMIAAGVPASGAAGSSHASLSNLRCTVDPTEVRQEDGGGAKCAFASP